MLCPIGLIFFLIDASLSGRTCKEGLDFQFSLPCKIWREIWKKCTTATLFKIDRHLRSSDFAQIWICYVVLRVEVRTKDRVWKFWPRREFWRKSQIFDPTSTPSEQCISDVVQPIAKVAYFRTPQHMSAQLGQVSAQSDIACEKNLPDKKPYYCILRFLQFCAFLLPGRVFSSAEIGSTHENTPGYVYFILYLWSSRAGPSWGWLR